MKDANEVLRQKEAELDRLRREIESLQVAAPLLCDDLTSNDLDATSQLSGDGTSNDLTTNDLTTKKASAGEKAVDRSSDSQATGTDDLFSSIAGSRPGFWESLKRKK
jgi:hypothetical protein